MDSRIGDLFLRPCWKLPYLRLISSRRTVILLYHGVPRESAENSITGALFEQHVTLLKQHFEIVSANQLWAKRGARDKIRVVLTFDDGFRNHAEVVAPILKKYNVPATFFVCSRPSAPGKYLWFAYLQALEHHFQDKGFVFRERFFDMSSDQRHGSVEQLRNLLLKLEPHPISMYEAIERELPRLEDFVDEQTLTDRYAGMTAEQVNGLSQDPLFSIGIHTVDHPFLTRCRATEARRQILDNRKWIEKVSDKPCDSIAYPSGDYNAQVLEQCRDLGLDCGHALSPKLRTDPQYELPRIGIYSASADVLGFKAQWGNLLRTLRMRVG